MKIRVYCEEPKALIKNIRDRAENGEWKTWTTEEVALKGDSSVRRLVHCPHDDNQYLGIQLALSSSSDMDTKIGNLYVELKPKLKKGAEMDESLFYSQSAIVMGRFCEILNNDFPEINEYHVYLKD